MNSNLKWVTALALLSVLIIAIVVPDILQEAVNYLTYVLMGLDPASQLGGAINFFIYETIKILILLTVIIFAIAFFRSYISPLKVRKALAKRNEYVGNVIAALIGVPTPFCSCSAVPLFIGFVESGVPLGGDFFLSNFFPYGK